MKRIYLASSSRARAQLLKSLGVRFTVIPSHLDERMPVRASSYSRLVIHNARQKAAVVAHRLRALKRTGVVIAADTIVVQDSKISGKPRNRPDARRMLQRLSRKPHWLYTGVAVTDVASQRTVSACEKTKVYMDAFSDAEIRRYFARVSPFDKAGGYDIQGRGGLFIRRIEGCYFNVVGLPVRALYLLLKKLKVSLVCLFCLAAALALSSCSSEYNLATKQEEAYFYSTAKEERMGSAMNKQVLDEYKLVDDPLVQKRVEDIGKKIVAVCDRKDIPYHFCVIKEDEVNAVSLPGGYVYIFTGLIDRVKSDDELAGVIAHEVGHIVARHHIKRLQGELGYSLLRVMAAAVPKAGEVAATADLAFNQLMAGWSQEDELLADQLGARYAKLAGYNPRAMMDFLKTLHEVERRKPPTAKSYFKTHPYSPDRIREVKQELGEELNFNDYLNVEQKGHGE